MALAVLVVFEKDEDALDFVEHLEGHKMVYENEAGQFVNVEAAAPAIYKFPTMFHFGHSGKKTEAAFTKGQKYGWWVCSMCKRPSRLYWESVVGRESSFGKNIKRLFFDDVEEYKIPPTPEDGPSA